MKHKDLKVDRPFIGEESQTTGSGDGFGSGYGSGY